MTAGFAGCSDSTAPQQQQQPAAVASVEVTPSLADMFRGEAIRLTAIVRDSAGNRLQGRAVSWSTSDAGVATIDSTGLVIGSSVGQALISVICEGVSDSAQINVVDAGRVDVEPAVANVVKGGQQLLSATVWDRVGQLVPNASIVWSSSDTLVATIDSTGLLTATGSGPVTISAASGDYVGTAEVTAKILSFTLLSTAEHNTCGLTSEGEIYCWGENAGGYLGDGTTEDRLYPVPIKSDLTFIDMDVGAPSFSRYSQRL